MPVLALDIGGTKLATAVVTSDGTAGGVQVAPTNPADGPERILDRLATLADASIATARGTSGAPLTAVGITSGGPLDPRAGIVHRPIHLPDWDGLHLTGWAEQRFGLPATLANDASAAALAEYRWGNGADASALLYLTLSTGIGGGLVVDGRPYDGATGTGGEPGHAVVLPDGRACPCGRRGCLEAYCSGPAIAARAAEALAATSAPSTLRAVPRLEARDVAQGVRAGDPVACDVWAETVDILGRGLVDLANVLDLDRIVLGGGVAQSADLLIAPLQSLIAADAMQTTAATCQVCPTALGTRTALLGAAAVALDRPALVAKGR